jgi:Galactose oxidase, central domain/Dockerin type I domain/Kelch motif
MNLLTQSKNTTILPVLIALMLGCFGLLPAARAVDPPPDGGYPTAEGEDGVLSLNTPASGSWTATGSLHTARNKHTATLLQNGMVLVAGGIGSLGVHLTSAELYDPASGTWTATGSMGTARCEHTATLLPSGKVLVAGGYNGPALSSAELYDPASGTWTATGSMRDERGEHTATVLPNGKVLVVGGFDLSSAWRSGELYDPVTGTWTATGSMGTARDEHTATLLPNGKVLVAGGSNGVPLSSAELYVSDGGGGLTLDSASSIQRGFAIDLPLSGPSGVEDRSGGPNKKFYVAMTFNNNITSVGSATTTCGGVSTWSISGSTVTFNLVGVAHGCNESDITITANDVMDDMGNTLTSASVAMGLLLGDVNGDRVVDGFDRRIVRSYLGQHTDGTNYRSDVSNDGFINHSDKQLVEQQQGTSLP